MRQFTGTLLFKLDVDMEIWCGNKSGWDILELVHPGVSTVMTYLGFDRFLQVASHTDDLII